VNVLVVGGGSWGTAFACVLARRGHAVLLGCRSAGAARLLAGQRGNDRYLPGVPLEPQVEPVALALPAQSLAAELVVLAVPSRSFPELAGALQLADGALALSLTKGLERGSGRVLLDVLCERSGLPPERVAVLSGPNHAEEVGRGHPAAAVVASASEATAERLQHELTGGLFRVYASADVTGVQLCAAAKNVIALAAGACDALGFGDNAKAALVTRGLAEMARLGSAYGADPRTYAGLAGMGDLVATCTSRHSRNRRAGELLAEGVAAASIEERIGMAVEGLATAPSLALAAAVHGVELPITDAVRAVVEGMPLADALQRLLQRVPAAEF
jgi:glycerol-3-phosphate dehydrogenase (NAD(P)+)